MVLQTHVSFTRRGPEMGWVDGHVRCSSVEPPLVSFCVSNHNYGRYLRPLIDALLTQTHERVEIVVVDDGSTDESREVLADYRDRVVVDFQEQQGQSMACNRAFALSSGDLVVFHDSDDLTYPHAAARLVEAFADPATTVVMNRMDVIDSDGRVLPGERRPPHGSPLWGGDLRGLVLERCAFNWPETTGQAYRRSFLDAVMPIPEYTPPDGYFSYLGALAGRVVVIEDPIASYRTHGANKHLAPRVHGLPWLDQQIAQREHLFDTIRDYGLALSVFADEETAAAWDPHDYILTGLRAARCSLAGEPGRWRYAAEGVRAIVGHPQFRYRSRTRYVAWFVAIALLPRRLARRVILAHFPQAQ